MPVIPIAQPTVRRGARLAPEAGAIKVPQAPPEVYVNPDAAGRAAGAASGALSRAFEISADFAVRLDQAKQETLFNNKRIETRKKVSEFETGLQGRQDFDAIESDFEGLVQDIYDGYTKEVTNQNTLERLQQDLAELAIQRTPHVVSASRAKAIDFGKASYVANKESWINLFGAADETERAAIRAEFLAETRNTLAAGYLNQQEAQAHIAEFNRRADLNVAERDMRADPDNFDPDNYEHLTPEARISLGEQAVRLTEANQRERIRIRDKAEKAEEKRLDVLREQRAGEMWVQYAEGKLTLQAVNEAITSRSVPLDEGKALQALLVKEAKETDDTEALLSLTQDIIDGAASRTDILNAQLTDKTKAALLEKRERYMAPENRHEYKRAVETIKAFMITEFGPMGQFVKADENQAYVFAINELDARIRSDEEIWPSVYAILKARGAIEPARPELLAGTVDQAREAAVMLAKMRRRGEISDAAYKAQIGLIKGYQDDTAVYRQRIAILKQLADLSKGGK